MSLITNFFETKDFGKKMMKKIKSSFWNWISLKVERKFGFNNLIDFK